jgi:hypothetical protein
MKIFVTILSFLLISNAFAQPIISDHRCTHIKSIPVAAIEAAKNKLHIGYGHTSHGSQITTGMTGLVDFMTNNGYPTDLFQWNSTGDNGALHLYEGGNGDLDGDVGYYPDWVQETRDYLGAPDVNGHGSNHPEMNVIMWSWCGQLSGYSREDIYNHYLNELTLLESDYPGVTFIYMTCHSDGSGLDGDMHKNNQIIRDYCIANNKVMFDFYDIECYNPDGAYFGDKHVSDDCSCDGGNWAQEWQNSHQEGKDWFSCESAHSEPLNANQKAYAIWWLWARIAGWDGSTSGSKVSDNQVQYPNSLYTLEQNYPNPFNSSTQIHFTLKENADVKLSIFNLRGQEEKTYINVSLTAGEHSITIDLANYPSGIYYYQFQCGLFRETRRLVLLR